jgi:membrane fusion protein (multidrug efflux system)
VRRAALALAAFAALAGCSAERPPEAAAVRPVVVVPVSVESVEDRLAATGQLLARDRAEVAAQVEGEITEVGAEEGDAVAAGAPVLAIDPERRQLELDRARAQVAEGEATVAEMERELRRVRALADQKVASQNQLDQAETGLATARARWAAARAQLGVAERALRDATVTARFAGMVARRHVHRGEYVAPGQKLFELVSLDPVEVEFDVPEADAGRIRKGLVARVEVAPYPGEAFEGVVTIVSPTIDPRTRTLRARAEIPNPDGRLRPGLFARVDLGVARREGVLTVPEEAVLQRAEGAVVFRVVGDRAERRVVALGAVRGGRAEVREGLAPGDRVVQRGHADLPDGAAIRAGAEAGASADAAPGTDGSAR